MRNIYSLWLVLLCIILNVYSCKTASVIIVGAGASGIAAATRLLENGFSDIKIFEAENRIGGRIYSIIFGDGIVDLGAEWCHGEGDNVVYQLTKEYNILAPYSEPEKILYSNGEYIDDKLAKDILEFGAEIESNVSLPFRKGISVGDYALSIYNTSLLSKYSNDKEKTKIAMEALDFLNNYLNNWESSATWFDLAYQKIYEEEPGDQNLHWNGFGFKTILEILMKKFPDPSQALPIDDKFLPGKEVVSITWPLNTTKPVKVQVLRDEEEYLADHVILTPSVGVFKEKYKSMFNPPLPPEKEEVIEVIGFGTVMKIVMYFENVWWNDSDIGYNLMWSSEDKLNLKNDVEGPVKDGVSWLYYLNLITFPKNNSHVLSAWICGNMVPETEQLPNHVLENGIMYAMVRFLGKRYNVSKPEKILRTSFHSNPHFRGAYTYETVQGTEFDGNPHEIFARPLLNVEEKPVVLFGGEATSYHHFSTVHGAIEAGFREADRIIELYKEKR